VGGCLAEEEFAAGERQRKRGASVSSLGKVMLKKEAGVGGMWEWDVC